jgi:hypothetical protein
MSTHRLDHVAIEVGNLESFIDAFSKAGLLRLIRTGTLGRTGQRIAMLGDGTGVKIELIETPTASEPRFAHVAFAVEDIGQMSEHLRRHQWRVEHGPNELRSAKAWSVLMAAENGLRVQVIAYQPDSPDLASWADLDWPVARQPANDITPTEGQRP